MKETILDWLVGIQQQFLVSRHTPTVMTDGYTGWHIKTSRALRNITARILNGEKNSVCAFVDQYVLLLTYKFQ